MKGVSLLNRSFSLLLLNLITTVLLTSCGSNGTGNKERIIPYNVKGLDTIVTASGLRYIMVKANKEGKLPPKGRQVRVHYTGYFEDGSVFDSSVSRGEPLMFALGIGQVIKGWDEGIALLHVGEKARFIIPYDLAYGIEGSGPIPPMATLIFDVELITVVE